VKPAAFGEVLLHLGRQLIEAVQVLGVLLAAVVRHGPTIGTFASVASHTDRIRLMVSPLRYRQGITQPRLTRGGVW